MAKKAKKKIAKMTPQQIHRRRYRTGATVDQATIAELLENCDLTTALRTQQYLSVERVADLIGRDFGGVKKALGKLAIGRLLSKDGQRIVLSDVPAFELKKTPHANQTG